MVRLLAMLAAAAVLLLAIPVLTFALLWGDGLGGCGNSVVETARSPDGRLDAVLFERNCGATTGFSTQISVVPAGEQPEGGGNIFVTDDSSAVGEQGHWGGAWADASWLSERRLHIDHAPNAGVLKSLTRFEGVTITYGTSYPPVEAPPQTSSDDAARSAGS